MAHSKQSKKRKLEDECCVFSKVWIERYFFTDVGDKAVCLICSETVSVFKEYNVKRHFETKDNGFGNNLSNEERQKKATTLAKRFKQQQTMFKKSSSLQRNVTKASFVSANKIAKQNKSFSDREFIKECMVDAISVVCPEIRSKVEAISLSRRSIARRIDAIAVNIQVQLLRSIEDFQWFSIALVDSTDLQETAQLLIYIRGINENFQITEELLTMESLKGTTTGKDMYNSIINSLSRSRLSLDKLASITTNGAPSLTGTHSGLVKLINNKIEEDFPTHSALSFHCIIHQESLCKSSLQLKHAMDPVVHAVNLLRARELKHRQFRSLLEDMEADFTDVLYHTNVRWLSMGRVLNRVWDLKTELIMFLNMNEIVCDFSREMERDEWVCDFAFAVDIMEKLNDLNTKLQGKGAFAHELHQEVKGFQLKLQLFAKQLNEQNFVHFPLLKTQAVKKHYQETAALS